jgi:hypothetical protein
VPPERDALTPPFRVAEPAVEYDPRFGSWQRFIDLMEAIEALCSQWPPPRPPFQPLRGPFLL